MLSFDSHITTAGAAKLATDVKRTYDGGFDSHTIRTDVNNKVAKEDKHLMAMDDDDKAQKYYRSWSDEESDPSPVSAEDYLSQVT